MCFYQNKKMKQSSYWILPCIVFIDFLHDKPFIENIRASNSFIVKGCVFDQNLQSK